MRLSVPVEREQSERRVALTPDAAGELAAAGHRVLIESGAGAGAGFADGAYEAAAARVTGDLAELFGEAEAIVKIGAPGESELRLLQPSHLLLGFLNLPAHAELAGALCDSGATCIALEEVTSAGGGLPLLAPMSELAGSLAVIAGADLLAWPAGGPGVHLGGAPGVAPAAVAVIGAGAAGMAAARRARALGASVVVLDDDIGRLRAAARGRETAPPTLFATSLSVSEAVARADLVIGAPGLRWRRAPVLVTRSAWAAEERPAAVVDVTIDRGGCFETSRPAPLGSPPYKEDGVLHHCVPNLPSATAVTAAAVLSAALPAYLRRVAAAWEQNGLGEPLLRSGVALHRGRARQPALARATGLPYAPLEGAVSRRAPLPAAA